MKKSAKGLLLGLLLVLAFPVIAQGADKTENISLLCSKVSIGVRGSIYLKPMISPVSASRKKISWKSSNSSIASVSSSGLVRGNRSGTATITASIWEGKKASKVTCEVRVTSGDKRYVINTTAGPQKYTIYNQVNYRGLGQTGCVLTSVAIAASHYGFNYNPTKLHSAPASAKYGERYAVKDMPGSTRLYGRAALSVAAASRMLKNMGIKNKPVYKYNADKAIKEIKKYAKAGKPVLVKVYSRTYKGLRLAGGHHMMVLVGLDPEGYAILTESYGGKINYAHMSYKYFRISISRLVKEHMKPASGNYKNSYVTSMSSAGGYILIDGKEDEKTKKK